MANLRERKPDKSKLENTQRGEKLLKNDVDSPDETLPEKKGKKKKQKAVPATRGFCSLFCSRIKYFFLLIFVPPFLNYASLQKETTELRPDGELYDIGWGQKLFLSCSGKGPPTVVFDSPTGFSSDVWILVKEKLQSQAKVCVYDRAGLGFSERPFNRTSQDSDGEDSHFKHSTPFTIEKMVDDLHKLISSSSQQPRPLILVGAELGAIVSQFYTLLYENDVAGLVLINPLPDDLLHQNEAIWSNYWFGNLVPTFQMLQLAASLGITRLGLLVGALKQPITGQHVPHEVINRQKHLMCHPRHLSSVVDEHFFINQTMSQLKTLRMIRPLPSGLPVSVLTGNYYDAQMTSSLNKAWARAEQSLLSKVFPTAQHLVVNGADRHMMYRKPLVITETVSRIIRNWKRSKQSESQTS